MIIMESTYSDDHGRNNIMIANIIVVTVMAIVLLIIIIPMAVIIIITAKRHEHIGRAKAAPLAMSHRQPPWSRHHRGAQNPATSDETDVTDLPSPT